MLKTLLNSVQFFYMPATAIEVEKANSYQSTSV